MTPIKLTTDPTAQDATMTLVAQGFGPLVALENGQLYTLVNGNTYLAVPDPTATDHDAYQIEDPATGTSSPGSTSTRRSGTRRPSRRSRAA